jgi:Protein of unknown function (DUF4031)
MTVYVDSAANRFRGMLMYHMIADTLEELHAAADRIGVTKNWWHAAAHFPHYDICESKRALALANGAVAVGRREFVKVIRRIRAAWRSSVGQLP